MSLRTARSLDEVYEAVESYDLVVTDDGPLSLALDNRIRRPRLGRLAATPRSHASGELVPENGRELFVQFLEETELPWKSAARALELCTACWSETGDLERILAYPEFDTEAIREAVAFLSETESSYAAVEASSLPDHLDVAVVDEGQLNALDRSYLPDEYDAVSSLVDEGEGEPLPTLHVYPSATAIVDAVLEAIDAENAADVGVVVPTGSRYASLIEAGLAARGIPKRSGTEFADDPAVRAFCRLVESAFAGTAQRVEELRPALSAVGVHPPRSVDERRVDAVSGEDLGGYDEFRRAVAEGTFRDALRAFESVSGSSPTGMRDQLATLGLLDDPLTEARFADVRYYLEAFDVPGTGDGAGDGVLLTGATETAYVDRPVVFYLGVGPDWARSPPAYPWIDSAEFLRRDVRRFERLLGNGRQRYVLVQETRAGEDVQPCVYLRRLLDREFDSFTDLDHVRHRGEPGTEPDRPFTGPTSAIADAETVETVSQSHLNALANSPRDAYFDRLVETPASLPMERGRVLHEAAEIHVADPTVIPERREAVLDAMCELLDPYLDGARRPVQRTELDVGLDAVVETLDRDPPEEAAYETYDVRERENELAEALGVEANSPLAERWFESPAVGVHGYVDLLAGPTAVVDYKTGAAKDAGDHLAAASVDPVADRPDFQALVYLAKHREERPGERLSIRFVYLLDDDHVAAAIAGDPPVPEERVTTITYVPASFGEFVAGREAFESVTDYADSNPRVKALSKLGYDAYRRFFEAHELPREGVDPERRERVTREFVAYAQERVGEYAYVEEGCTSVIDDLADAPEGYVLRSDLDAVEAFVEDRIAELNAYRTSRFPVAFRNDGPTWDRVDHRDLILTDR
ncbi:PD-(D/E)XK nuclease family protein [Halorubrum sp. CSM-61]|uniref:PD-(D/E)XK nuclease family protein n=1 Tax=Halorubrum sp. CSM-61 TaxID=2485838 RepID=UPI000F4C488A|nr:PD-(D/E)XK nuclease family protein [Halorubrum sp. CSM-61]